MTSVVVARIASAIGSESDSAFCWSRKPAVCPPTRTGTGASTARTSRTSSLACSPSAPAAARRGRSGRGRRPAARAARRRRPAARRAAARSARSPRGRPRRRAPRCRSGSCGWAGTRVSSASSTTRADWSRGSTLASTPVNLTPRNGIPSAISSVEAPTAIGTGRRMTQMREPVPEAAALAGGVAVQRRLEALRAERVHARAERGEDRRQQRQRDERRHQRADHARRRPSSRGSAAGTRAATASAAATVIEENSTVRPAVAIVAAQRRRRSRARARAPRGSARP